MAAHWHRDENGVLQHGQLVRSTPCSAHFEIYYPNEDEDSDSILMICRGQHSHPNPCPTRTPKSIEILFLSLLDTLGPSLAYATPRQLILDSAFRAGLRNILHWNEPFDPCLSDLHPLLANLDNAARLINKRRLVHFPDGTGYEGK